MKPLGSSFFSMLLSHLYGSIIRAKNYLYAVNMLRSYNACRPVISIGGIHAGGVGKTPMAAYIIEYLLGHKRTAVLLSRGYKKTIKGDYIVSPADTCLWEMVGDEPAMLRRRYPSLWLGINPNRYLATQKMGGQLDEAAVFVLDDGFSHQKLFRDLNIVCLPAMPKSSDLLIPAGYLREPYTSVSRADIICIIGLATEKDAIQNRCELMQSYAPRAVVAGFVAESEGWVHARSGEVHSKPVLEGSVAIVTGIANPKRFVDTVTAAGIKYDTIHSFGDHHVFNEDDVSSIMAGSVKTILTTEKDIIRLSNNGVVKGATIWYLTIQLTPVNPSSSSAFSAMLDKVLFAPFSSSGGFR